MLLMPIWAWIIFFITGGIVYVVMLPKRIRDAADRKRLFEDAAAITCREYPIKKRYFPKAIS
jgi:hypothetical protein